MVHVTFLPKLNGELLKKMAIEFIEEENAEKLKNSVEEKVEKNDSKDPKPRLKNAKVNKPT